MSFINKALRVLRHRPIQAYQHARGVFLFVLARVLRPLTASKRITLQSNVRLQRNSCLMAEAPSGRITVQSHTIVYEDAALEAYGDGHIIIGEKSIIGGGRFVSRYQIRVGDRFLCSWNVLIQDFDSHPTDPVLRQYQVEKMVAEFYPRFDGGCPEEGDGKLNWAFPGDPILIGDDVWVCANAIIMKGANIGNGCIVAAGAIVLKGIYPPFSLIAGNPARVVKMLS